MLRNEFERGTSPNSRPSTAPHKIGNRQHTLSLTAGLLRRLWSKVRLPVPKFRQRGQVNDCEV